jgi:hypothetical protein
MGFSLWIGKGMRGGVVVMRCRRLQDGENRKEVLLAVGAMYPVTTLLSSFKQYCACRLSRMKPFSSTVNVIPAITTKYSALVFEKGNSSNRVDLALRCTAE